MTTAIAINRMPESDIHAHIEDSPLFWVWRHGQPVKLAWNELSRQERAWQVEAERREQFVAEFEIY